MISILTIDVDHSDRNAVLPISVQPRTRRLKLILFLRGFR